MKKFFSIVLQAIGVISIILGFIGGFIMVALRSVDSSGKAYDFFGLPAGNDFNTSSIFLTPHGWITLIVFWGMIAVGYGLWKLSEKMIK